MPLDNEVILKIEELKEVGHECRYREQLMVQEFGLSMVVTGVAIGVIATNRATLFSFVVQCFGLVFLILLALNLRNLNQDRSAALRVKEKLQEDLGFQSIHQGRRRGWPPISSSKAMVQFAATVAVGWALWLAITANSLARSYYAELSS